MTWETIAGPLSLAMAATLGALVTVFAMRACNLGTLMRHALAPTPHGSAVSYILVAGGALMAALVERASAGTHFGWPAGIEWLLICLSLVSIFTIAIALLIATRRR